MVGRVGGWRRRWLAAASVIACAMPGMAAAEAGPGYAAILVDGDTREVLYANGADLPRHPASVTKIMTLFLAFDALASGRLHLNDQIVISRHAAAQAPSHLGLAPGQTIGVDDAIRVIAVKSANDIAVALAERLGGTEDQFADMMNRKARSLGMRNTNFVNATGLPNADHVTTARDLAILAEALIHTYPRYYTYFSTEKFQYEKMVFANHNHLLGRLPGMDGIKTGYTVDAGFTLAASAVRNGHRMIAVVLGEPTAAARDRDVTALIDTGFAVEAGRAQGQSVSVASLLAPLSHPAIRIALPGIDQGSGDDRAAPPPPRRRLPSPEPMADRRGGGRAHPVAVASRHQARADRLAHDDAHDRHGHHEPVRLAEREARGRHEEQAHGHAGTRLAARGSKAGPHHAKEEVPSAAQGHARRRHETETAAEEARHRHHTTG